MGNETSYGRQKMAAKFSHVHDFPPEYVIDQLNETFGTVLNLDVIRSVAESCKFDVVDSSNKLLELSDMMEEDIVKEQDIAKWSVSPKMPVSAPRGPVSSSVPAKLKSELNFENTIKNIKEGYRVMVILRGLPGSGKSYLAKQIINMSFDSQVNYEDHIFSTDDFFLQNNSGLYKHDPIRLQEAHGWNQLRAFQAVVRGLSPVIIDNTNTQMWEMKPYATMAVDSGYILYILEPNTQWCFNVPQLFTRNAHGVPREKIKEMLGRYERNITPESLLRAFNLKYERSKPPLKRLCPLFEPKPDPSVNEDVGIDLMDFDDNNVKQPNGDAIEISSEEDDIDPKEIDIFSKLNKTWGIDETTLKSWDVVTPLNEFESSHKKPQPKIKEIKIQTTNSATNTDESFFKFLKNDKSKPGKYGSLEIRETVSRDINFFSPLRPVPIPKKLKLDKSCMTDELYPYYNSHMSELILLFPTVPRNHLDYWYKKFKGDLEWTIEILLENQSDILDQNLEEEEEAEEVPKQAIDGEQSAADKNISVLQKKKKKSSSESSSSEEKTEIKKILESKIDFGGEHYSKQLLRIKNYRLKKGNEVTADINRDGIISIDTESEEDTDDSCNYTETRRSNEMMELNLGDAFVSQLETEFSDTNLQYPKGFQPVIQLPKSIARQLYCFYIESIYQQMDNQNLLLESLLKEDFELAKTLQAKEEEEVGNKAEANVPNLREIQRDEKAAKTAFERELEKWREMEPETLASKLTKKKLEESFPSIPGNILSEILLAHGNNYSETVETLLASMDHNSVVGLANSIKEPPIADETLWEMKEAKKHYSWDALELEKDAAAYRTDANIYLERRKELHQKVIEYQRRGMIEVAQYYTGLISKQTAFIDRANSLAAIAFVEENTKRLEKFNTLDLHCLFVKEAISTLDVFLDRNINLLRHSNDTKEDLQIITGRGKNSANRRPKIRPAVIKHLKKRNITYTFLNPGLVGVVIDKNTKVTNELEL